jgi:hypothetical protein
MTTTYISARPAKYAIVCGGETQHLMPPNRQMRTECGLYLGITLESIEFEREPDPDLLCGNCTRVREQRRIRKEKEKMDEANEKARRPVHEEVFISIQRIRVTAEILDQQLARIPIQHKSRSTLADARTELKQIANRVNDAFHDLASSHVYDEMKEKYDAKRMLEELRT